MAIQLINLIRVAVINKTIPITYFYATCLGEYGFLISKCEGQQVVRTGYIKLYNKGWAKKNVLTRSKLHKTQK